MGDRCDGLWVRAVEAGVARWMPGMLMGIRGADGRLHDLYRLDDEDDDPVRLGVVPAWTDPATLGCLLALVRERHPGRQVHVAPDAAGSWSVWRHGPDEVCGDLLATGCTEPEALLRVLTVEGDDAV